MLNQNQNCFENVLHLLTHSGEKFLHSCYKRLGKIFRFDIKILVEDFRKFRDLKSCFESTRQFFQVF